MEQNWMEQIHLTESVMILSLVVAFLILAVFGQRKTWITTEVIMSTVFGCGFALFPGYLLSHQTTGTLKSTEIALARLYGVILMCSGISWYRTKETSDATVTITLMMSRVFTSSALFVSQIVTWQAGSGKVKAPSSTSNTTAAGSGSGGGGGDVKWSEQFVLLFAFPTSLWMLGNLLHLFRSHDFSTYPQHNIRLNNHLRLDSWFILLLGVAWLAFPSQMIGAIMTSATINKVALHIGRCIGTLYIGEAIVSLQAPGFLHVRDKQALFLSRIISLTLQLAAVGVSAFLGVVAVSCVPFIVLAGCPSVINAVIGFMSDSSAVFTVQAASPPKYESLYGKYDGDKLNETYDKNDKYD